MARFDVAGGQLILRLGFFERIGGFVHGDATIPLENVRGARAVDDPWKELRGTRSPGIELRDWIALGSWRFPGGKDFVALRRRGPGVVVNLTGVEYARLVVSAHDNAAAIADEIDRRGLRPF
jgi:hypothetical protein